MEREIKDFNNYIINDSGVYDKTIWSIKSNKFLKPCVASNGYYMVNLRNGGITYSKTLHSLIAEAFIPNLENKPCIDHINGNRLDCRVENLRWCTYSENNSNPVYISRKKGQKRSDETREKMRAAKLGKPSPRKVAHFNNEKQDAEVVE